MLGRYNLYENDITLVKQLGYHLKVIHVSACRVPGLESDVVKHQKKNTVNSVKLDNNISRACSKVQEYALCNEWNYYVTMTLDPVKYDRYNLRAWQKDLHDFLHNFNRRRSLNWVPTCTMFLKD